MQEPDNSTLEEIRKILSRMDRRDYWRTVFGGIHATIALIPMVLFVLSIIYVYLYGSSILSNVSGFADHEAINAIRRMLER